MKTQKSPICYTTRATEPFTLLEPRMDHSCIMGVARGKSMVVVSGGGNELGIINTTETRNAERNTSYEWTEAGETGTRIFTAPV